MFDLFLLDDFLDLASRDAVFADARAAAGAAATVHGQGDERLKVAPSVRHAMRLEVSEGTRRLIDQRLSELKPALTERFGISLSTHEPPQFLRYETGGYFVAHQDGNTPLTRDRTLTRRISIVIFLNPQTADVLPGTYAGGELVFHAPYPNIGVRESVIGTPGALLAFRSETTHEVTMVTGGERYTIATWFHGAD